MSTMLRGWPSYLQLSHTRFSCAGAGRSLVVTCSLSQQRSLSYEHAQLLRKCFARHIQERVAMCGPHEALEALGIHLLPGPPAASPEACPLAALGRQLSTHGPAALATHLEGPFPAPEPPEGAGKCCLVCGEYYTLRDERLERFLQQLFEHIATHTEQHSVLPPVSLSRFDLFHAHLYLAPCATTAGLLFHAKEYPAYHPQDFPLALGYCQQDSPLAFDQRHMDLRNFVYTKGRLFCLDTGAGGLAHGQLLWPETLELRTIYEEDMGTPLADIYYLPSSEFSSCQAADIAQGARESCKHGGARVMVVLRRQSPHV